MLDRYQNLLNVIRIINTDGIGSVTFFKLLKLYKSSDKILQSIQDIGKYSNKIPSVEFAKKEVDFAYKNKIKIILWNDSDYPNSLSNLYSKSVILYTKGNSDLLHKRAVGIVGTRNPTIVGKNFIYDLSKRIVQNEFNIISGMAIGIDTAAHKGAIDDNNANTIAVLAGGVNNIYPLSNRLLYNEIVDKGGLVLSEQPIDYVAKASDFPKRNRIIAGLSIALIVTEATDRSGSLITANYAMKQGKLIYCIPAHPSDPRSYGPNNLIANGAKIFLSYKDLISDLENLRCDEVSSNSIEYKQLFKESSMESDIPSNMENKSEIENYIINSLSSNPIDSEDIFQDLSVKFNISISKFSELILRMELNNLIVNFNGQIIKI